MAKIECDLCMKAAYFFLPDAPFYNVANDSTLNVFQNLRVLGHEIGLHFDAAPYANDTTVLQEAAIEQCATLVAAS